MKKKIKKAVVKTPKVRESIKTRDEVEKRIGGKTAELKVKKSDDDFPLVGEEQRQAKKMEARSGLKKPKSPKVESNKIAAPKKKTLTPEMIQQLATKQGVKRKIVKNPLAPSTKKASEDHFPTLTKFFGRRDDYTQVDPRELYGALETANPKLLKWMVNLTSEMKDDDVKTVKVSMRPEYKLTIRKITTDMYSGHVSKADDAEVIHLYDRLTIPALVTQIMSVCEIYEASNDLENLYGEIKHINAEIKQLKEGKSRREDIESKLSGIIERLSGIDKLAPDDDEKVAEIKPPKAETEEKELIQEVQDKLSTLKDKVTGEIEELIEPAPEVLPVKRISEAKFCSDCNSNPCVCYSHLSSPTIEISPVGHIKIFFKSDWNQLDKNGFCKTMGYFPLKK